MWYAQTATPEGMKRIESENCGACPDSTRTRQSGHDASVKPRSTPKHEWRQVFCNNWSISNIQQMYAKARPTGAQNLFKRCPEAPKINNFASRKNSQISEAKQTPKILKKGSGTIGPAECADRGEDYGGGRKLPKLGKIWKKWKTEVDAKDGEKNLEDPARYLARRP